MSKLNNIIIKRAKFLVNKIDLEKSIIYKVKKNLKYSKSQKKINKNNINQYIDHTNLSFDTAKKDIKNLVDETVKFKFYAVCVNPCWISFVGDLRNKYKADFKIASVIDFPLGASISVNRLDEIKQTINDGAEEQDIVANNGFLKSKMYNKYYKDLDKCINYSKYSKIILELSELNMQQKIDAILMTYIAGADMIKTSTGINGIAKLKDVKLINKIVDRKTKIKAAGGIRDFETAAEMIETGADRIGASKSLKIIG